MPTQVERNLEEQILILAPIGQDAAVAQAVLDQAALDSNICHNALELSHKFEQGAGVILISEEALGSHAVDVIKNKVNGQPAWSDIPIILLTSRGSERKAIEIYQAFGMDANIHLLERTFKPITLVSIVQVALRARRRQYEVRDLLLTLEQNEKNLKKSAQELNQSNKELEQFAYVASHDLQEPVRMVANYIDLLRVRCEGKFTAEEKEYFQYVAQGAERAQHMIRSLLEFSQIDKRTGFSAVSVKDVLDKVLSNLKLAIEESHAEIVIGPMPVVRANAFQMMQVFQNLIGNAIKYRGAAPLKIAIDAKKEGDNYLFTVQDNGIGIAPEFHEKIFELFQRLHTKDKYSGAGLGLAICKKIAELHGGKIWIQSQPGKGSCFLLTVRDLE